MCQEEFEDTKGAIRICQSNRQYNDQKKKDKRTNNDLQNICSRPYTYLDRTRTVQPYEYTHMV